MTILLFIAGLALLIVGAELLVRGASTIAAVAGISPLIIGLTVVAFGTSSPELAVSIKAALSDQASIAVGNVVGSNIFNVLFILGLSAMIVPLVISRQLIRLEVPLLIVVSMVVMFFSLDGRFGRSEGVILVMGLAGYIAVLIYLSRRAGITLSESSSSDSAALIPAKAGWAKNLLMVFGGLLLLVVGARWLVDAAVSFAQFLGVSELVIGLTIIAAGTSLPEVVTSIIAAMRGERDIAVGNVIGSNLFNLLGVLGIASIIAPTGIEIPAAVVKFDLPVMVAVAFACLPIFFTGAQISRREGALLLGYYLAYTLYIILAASHHEALAGFSTVMLYFVVPLSAATLIYTALKQFRVKG